MLQVDKKCLHANTHKGSTTSDVLLSTAVVRVKTNDAQLFALRALIDTGSQASMISERAASLLALPQSPVNANITGVSETPIEKCSRLIHVNIQSRTDPNFEILIDADCS